MRRVGLGKTIEAGLVLAQLRAEGKGHILIVVPLPLARQWQVELENLFGIRAQPLTREQLSEEQKISAPSLPSQNPRPLERGIYIAGREFAGSPRWAPKIAQLAELESEQDASSVGQALPALQERIAAARAALVVPEGNEVRPEVLQSLEQQLREIEVEMETGNARRHQLMGELQGQTDLFARSARAEEQLAKAAAAQRRTELKAMGAQLLSQTFQTVRRELEQDVVRPLRERVSARLQSLTGPRYRELQMQPDFRVETLLTAEGHAASLGDLSFGTQEQLAFLSRLCLADLLSEKERSLVVFDDNLVHTDPERLQLACKMLEESAQNTQILLLTCHPERFLPLLQGARVRTWPVCGFLSGVASGGGPGGAVGSKEGAGVSWKPWVGWPCRLWDGITRADHVPNPDALSGRRRLFQGSQADYVLSRQGALLLDTPIED